MAFYVHDKIIYKDSLKAPNASEKALTFSDPDFIIQKRPGKFLTESEMYTFRRYKGCGKTVVIPDGVERLDNYIFANDLEPNSTIEKIIVPDSVVIIYPFAFSYCLALKEIQFSKNLGNFEVEFDNCPNVDEIWIPEKVYELGNLKCKDNAKIHIGENIREVNFSHFSKEDDKTFTKRKQKITETLLQNPAYKIIDGVMINTVQKVALYSMNQNGEVRIPHGVEVLASGAFYENRHSEGMVPVEKVFIPSSVKKIDDIAFHSCDFLKEVVYDGYAKDVEIAPMAFYLCVPFHQDGSDIIFKDGEKKPPLNIAFERILFIHKYLNAGKCINKNGLRKMLMQKFSLKKLSIGTIGRDIDFLRDCLYAPIAYDNHRKGYYYTGKFSLTF